MSGSFTITGSSAVTLIGPSTLAEVNVENVGTIVFSDNSYVAFHAGRSSEQLILTGVHTSSNVFTLMASVRTLMDNREEVTISGLPDSNFNSVYRIMDLGCVRNVADGYCVRYTLTLSRKHED